MGLTRKPTYELAQKPHTGAYTGTRNEHTLLPAHDIIQELKNFTNYQELIYEPIQEPSLQPTQ